MFLEALAQRNEADALSGARALLRGLGRLRHKFDCYFESSDDFGGEPAAYVDIFPDGHGFATDHKKFGGIFVRVWVFGRPRVATYGLFLGAERAEQSEPRRGVAYVRARLGALVSTFERQHGFEYHIWASSHFPWSTKSNRAVARQLEQFISFRQDPINQSKGKIEGRVGEAVRFLDAVLPKLKPIRDFGQDIIREYYSENLPPADVQPPSAAGNGDNIIFFGPPGTGKSHDADQLAGANPPPVRALFHPEYTYSDFFGLYRPVVGYDKSSEIKGFDGKTSDRPVCYFEFVPGPLLLALEQAFRDPEKQTFLIIDEINRGDCAAIFGDTLQLLDRLPDGASRYGITLRQEAAAYFKKAGVDWDKKGDKKLRFPANFTILATMNTSDQSLYPMDSAFKRRWQWRSCSLTFDRVFDFLGGSVPILDDGLKTWSWEKLVKALNTQIVKVRLEDKQIGPWFIAPAQSDAKIDRDAFGNKCLYYLWHDVFKDEQMTESSPFRNKPGIQTFQELQEKFYSEGLAGIFKETDLAGVEMVPAEPSTPEPTEGAQ